MTFGLTDKTLYNDQNIHFWGMEEKNLDKSDQLIVFRSCKGSANEV